MEHPWWVQALVDDLVESISRECEILRVKQKIKPVPGANQVKIRLDVWVDPNRRKDPVFESKLTEKDKVLMKHWKVRGV